MTELLVIDVGSRRISAAVAIINEDGQIDVTGLGCVRSSGLKQGVIIQIDSVVDALKRAVAEANAMAGTRLSHPIISVGGAHLKGQNVSGSVNLNYSEVTDTVLTRTMEDIQSKASVPNREILSVIPHPFILDSQSGIRSPHGMIGNQLKVHAHVITGASNVINNIKTSLRLANLEASLFVPSAVAVGQLLFQDERELGVCVVDIGLDTTDLMVISNGAPKWLEVLPIGGESLTNDLAVALKTPLSGAEQLKLQHGFAHTSLAPMSGFVQVNKRSDRQAEQISFQQLTAFLQPRVEEIAEIIADKLLVIGRLGDASTGFVLTGGTAQLPGITQVFESVLQYPCRVLQRTHQEGLTGLLRDPAHAVLAGLIQYGKDQEIQPKTSWLGIHGSMFDRMQKWIRGNF